MISLTRRRSVRLSLIKLRQSSTARAERSSNSRGMCDSFIAADLGHTAYPTLMGVVGSDGTRPAVNRQMGAEC